jgi:hypothetical protein
VVLRRRPAATVPRDALPLLIVDMAARRHALVVAVAAVVGPSVGTTREAPQVLNPAAADRVWEAAQDKRDPQVEGAGEEGKQ